jgi:hypothetical protein
MRTGVSVLAEVFAAAPIIMLETPSIAEAKIPIPLARHGQLYTRSKENTGKTCPELS